MRKICAQRANEIAIQFEDREFVAKFNMESVMYMQEELQKVGMDNISFQHFAAIALYSGIKVNVKEFTMDEAVAMVMNMRPSDISAVVDEYSQSVNGLDVAQNEEQLKKAVAQMLVKVNGTSM